MASKLFWISAESALVAPRGCEYDIGDLYSGDGLTISVTAIDLSASVDGLPASERNVGERMSSKLSPNTGDTPQDENASLPESAGMVPNDPAAGFQRGRIVWGRPPQPVFRAGPLPRDEGLARLIAMPPHPQAAKPTVKGSVASGVAGGSNIPQAPRAAQPQPAPASRGLGNFSNVPQTSRPAPQGAAKPAAPAGGILGGSLVPPAKPVAPLAAVTPQPEPKPVPQAPQQAAPAPVAPMPVAEEIVVMSELEPVVAPRRPVAGATQAEARMDCVSAKTSTAWGRWAVAAGALIIAAGVVVWWMNREPEAPVAPQETVAAAPETVTSETAAPVASERLAPEVSQNAPAVTQTATPTAAVRAPQRVTTEAPPRPAAAPVKTLSATPAARPATIQTAPASSQPAPVVVVTPPAEAPVVEQGPAPTIAAPMQSNPDAPVVTRPQKLD